MIKNWIQKAPAAYYGQHPACADQLRIGRRIVEHEQHGKDRAEYGELLMRTLAERLTEEFGRGFSKRNLDYMRRFYLDYADRLPRIVQKPSAQFVAGGIPQLLDWVRQQEASV